MECPKCQSSFISEEVGVIVGWSLVADKYTCLDCLHSWLENEREYEEEY